MRRLFQKFVLSDCAIQATPDHSAMVHGGIMLIKPNRTLYDTAHAILRERAFNYTHGFEFKGSPQQVILHPEKIVTKARGYWADTWKFVGGGSDQGLFSYLRTRVHLFAFDWNIRVRHFWAADKPWRLFSCKRFFHTASPYCQDHLKKYQKKATPNCMGREWPIL